MVSITIRKVSITFCENSTKVLGKRQLSDVFTNIPFPNYSLRENNDPLFTAAVNKVTGHSLSGSSIFFSEDWKGWLLMEDNDYTPDQY